MNILSLFDGFSTGRMAFENLGFKIDKYFTSEIDKYASAVSRNLFPSNIELGDIRMIDSSKLPKIDLFIGGSPCTDLSVAGLQGGLKAESLSEYLTLKENGVEFKGQSYLFWEYIRLLKEIKPKYFFLENVKLKGKMKKWEKVISEELGVEPYNFNSTLVSAQNRDRLYWTNIPNIQKPEDKEIVLNDILQDGFWSDREKAYCIDACYYKGGNLNQYFNKGRRQLVFSNKEKGKCKQVGEADIKGMDCIKRVYSPEGKCPTITAMGGGHREPKVAVYGGAIRGRYNEDGKINQNFECNGQEKLNALTTVQKDSVITDKVYWRVLTPIECERAQTLPDNTTKFGKFWNKKFNNFEVKEISKSQRYKMIGNGWTKDMICHFFKNLPQNYNVLIK